MSIRMSGRLLCSLLFTLNFATPAFAVTTPVIFNAPAGAKGGDIVALQGDHFGTKPTVYLDSQDGSAPVALPILQQHSNDLVSFQIPTSTTSAIIVRVVDSNGNSSPQVFLNQARAYHLDALTIVPKGAFKIFGRNLVSGTSMPVVTVGGYSATVNASASNEYMLVVTAPAQITNTNNVAITVDNGNGSGATQLDRNIRVIAGQTGDPFQLGVGWAAAFTPIANNVIHSNAKCDGTTDDTATLQRDFQVASAAGATLTLPAGTCIINEVQLLSNVVLQGAGKDVTFIRYGANVPNNSHGFYGNYVQQAGIKDLTIVNNGRSTESLQIQFSNQVFIKNVKVNLAGSGRSMPLTDNTNFVMDHVDVNQIQSSSHVDDIYMAHNAGFVFTNNNILFPNGANDFSRSHDGYIANNHFTRDATDQTFYGVIHNMVIGYSYRIAILNNTLDVLGAPIDLARNDGETILAEPVNGTTNTGTVVSATTNTLSDPSNIINIDPFAPYSTPGVIAENFGIAIVKGKGTGQMRRLVGYDATTGTITVDHPWDEIPDSTSNYATYVSGFEKALIIGNVLYNNPRGIWLYQSSVRDVDIVGNKIREGGGIYLKSMQALNQFPPPQNHLFNSIYNVRIMNNSISNTTGYANSAVLVDFARKGPEDWGTGFIGTVISGNTFRANNPNNLTQLADEVLFDSTVGNEGIRLFTAVEAPYGGNVLTEIRNLGAVLQDNHCGNCDNFIEFRWGVFGASVY